MQRLSDNCWLFVVDDKRTQLEIRRGVYKCFEAGNQDAVSDPRRLRYALDSCASSLAPQWANVRCAPGPQQVWNCQETRRGTSQGTAVVLQRCAFIINPAQTTHKTDKTERQTDRPSKTKRQDTEDRKNTQSARTTLCSEQSIPHHPP